MASPVQQALLGARLQEEPTAFGKWCIARGIRSLPAAPVHVCAFITDAAGLKPMKHIWPLVQEISKAHLACGLADPTAGGVVADLINSISMLEPPKPWPKDDQKARFTALPYDLQVFVVDHERRRELEIRRAMNDRADVLKKLASVEDQLERAQQKLAELKSKETPPNETVAADA